MNEKFYNYIIPPNFFGHEVNYDWLGGSDFFTENTDDAEIVINVGNGISSNIRRSGLQKRTQEMLKEVNL